MNFKPEPYLQTAVNEKNLRKIRVALSTYITKDPGDHDGEILKALDYINKNYGEVWEEHDNREKEPRDNWNLEYLGLLQSDLMHNFSKERFFHILEVGQVLFPKKQTEKIELLRQQTKSRKDRVKEKEDDKLGKYLMLAIATAVAGIAIYLITKE